MFLTASTSSQPVRWFKHIRRHPASSDAKFANQIKSPNQQSKKLMMEVHSLRVLNEMQQANAMRKKTCATTALRHAAVTVGVGAPWGSLMVNPASLQETNCVSGVHSPLAAQLNLG